MLYEVMTGFRESRYERHAPGPTQVRASTLMIYEVMTGFRESRYERHAPGPTPVRTSEMDATLAPINARFFTPTYLLKVLRYFFFGEI
jgi:hypothetical protein